MIPTARPATLADADEVLRLAALMYTTVGLDPDATWRQVAYDEFSTRLGDDVFGFVVDQPDAPGRLAASGMGVVHRRLPGPTNLGAQVGYVQWVATDPGHRRRGCARAVLTALIGRFAAAGIPWVELHATADGAPLYRSLGFDETAWPGLRRSG